MLSAVFVLLLASDVDGFFQAVDPGEGGTSSSSKSRIIDVRKRCKCEAARTLAVGGMVTRQLSYTHAERRKVGGRRVGGGRRKRKPSVRAYGGGGGDEGWEECCLEN